MYDFSGEIKKIKKDTTRVHTYNWLNENSQSVLMSKMTEKLFISFKIKEQMSGETLKNVSI